MTKVEYTITPSALGLAAGEQVRSWYFVYRWRWLAHLMAYFGSGHVNRYCPEMGYITAEVK